MKLLNCLVVGLTGLILVGPASPGEDDVAHKIRMLELKELQQEKPLQPWFDSLRARREAVNHADVKAWRAIKDRADWEKFKTPRLDALRASLGQFPEAPKKLEVLVTSTLQGDGFTVRNLVYQSQPGIWVTANLYVPEKADKKRPGFLIIHSHHNPKTQGELQDMGMTWARLGCYVLVPDQLGHGERRQHHFGQPGKYPADYKPGRQDYYFRYNTAMQLHVVGESLIGWMVWDMMRGVDLLLSQPDIDETKIILLGSVAGGGDPAAVTAALDPRIAAVVPFNFGGPQPETKFPLPEDAELAFNYMGGGGWESTRNLRLSAKGGFLPWLIVGSVAPRGLIHAHEFAWDQKRDPVWTRYQKIFAFYDQAERLSFVHGSGSVKGSPPESTHCNNIGAVHRKPMYPTFEKWFGIPIPAKDYQERFPSEKLQCWSAEHKAKRTIKTSYEAAAHLAHERLAQARAERAKLPADEASDKLRQQWAQLLGNVTPDMQSASFVMHKLAAPMPHYLGLRGAGMGAYLLLPPTTKVKNYPVVVLFAQAGIQALTRERADAIALLLDSGTGVCVAELRGMGLKEGRTRTSTATSLSASEQMFGETVIGHHVRELRELLAHLRTLKAEGVDGSRLALWGDSLAKVNPPDKRLDVPLDAPLPPHAEPGAALVALLTAQYEKDVRCLAASGGLVSYGSLLHSPYLYVPHDAVVPGALAVADWTDLVAALAPRPLHLAGAVDGLNRAVSGKDLAQAYASAVAAYQKIGQAQRLVLAQGASATATARWLAAQVQ